MDFHPRKCIDRDNFEEPLLIRNLIRQVKAINPIDLSDEDIKNLLNELRFKPSTQEGIKLILLYLKEGISIKIEKDKTLKRIRLFDYDNVQNNEFIVTRQAVYTRGNKQIRTDIFLYVNGIPLVDIECKNQRVSQKTGMTHSNKSKVTNKIFLSSTNMYR